MKRTLDQPTDNATRRARLWPALAAFLLLAAFMYGSIMYKIIHFGP